MTLRAVSMGLAGLLLSACSLLPSGKSSSSQAPLPRPPSGPEEIAEVTTELPPLGSDEAAGPTTPTSPRRSRSEGLSGGELSGGTPYVIGEDEPPRPASKGSGYKPPDPSTLPQAPMAGRVGLMSLLGNQLRHVHAGTTPFGDHEKSYDVQYDFNGYVMEELRKQLLAKTPYQPVMLNSIGALRQASNTWQKTWNGKSFAPTFQREFDGIMSQNRLDMIIVVSYDVIDDGVVGTSQTLTGSGLYTRSFLGKTQTAVFSTLQFYRIVGKPARLIKPIAPANDRSIGDLPNVKLPEELDDLPPRYLVPVYEPLRTIVNNKINGLISLPRKVGY